jgi:hypothetical protein
MAGPVRAGDVDLWMDQRGEGPDVLLIAGLGDAAEAWTAQLEGLADRYCSGGPIPWMEPTSDPQPPVRRCFPRSAR